MPSMRDILIGLAVAAAVILIYYQTSLLPLVALAGLLFLLYRFADLRTSRFSTTVGKPLHKKGKAVAFDQIGGQEMAKRELLEALDFLLKPEKVREMGDPPPQGSYAGRASRHREDHAGPGGGQLYPLRLCKCLRQRVYRGLCRSGGPARAPAL